MLRNFSVRTRNRFSAPTFKSNPSFRSPALQLCSVRFFTSKKDPSIESPNHRVPEPNSNQAQNQDVPADTEDASYKELKTRIKKFYEGDDEAVPSIFEAILERKLSGKHEESVDDLLKEFNPLESYRNDSGSVQNLKAQNHHQDSVMPRISGKLAMKLGSRKVKENISAPCAMSFSSSIHSVAPLNSQSRWNNDRPMNSEFQWNTSRPINSELNRPNNSELELNKDGRINSESGLSNNNSVGWNNNRPMNTLSGWSNRPMNFEPGNNTNRSMNFVRGILEENGRDMIGVPQQPRYTLEQNADVVHIKMLRNNCFVTLTDSNGNRKVGASSGSLKDKAEDKSKVAKVSGYAAEATAEHIGRLAKEMKLKSVVVKVNGFTFFKKKKQAILSFREGYTNGRGDANPIVYIEDTTRRPHNGCRLPKKRRI
ncbi:hypothetical protein RJ639_019101 [Escallonia herrerae]|uniref:Ribosomal protein S11 n=1 Tax=Escallonia herrerae TaxID=1293975 RepID=A0AA88V6F0_9ASTE|nr:hypothetical protein RJ639_019101 [Escallonia herrerae]